MVRPHVLVVTNRLMAGVDRQGSLARSGETEEQSHFLLLDADVGRRVERQGVELDRLEVVLQWQVRRARNRRSNLLTMTLLHLVGVLGTQDDHLHALEVDLDRGGAGHAGGETVGRELAGVVDDEVGLAPVGEFLLGRTDKSVILRSS